MLYVLFCNAFCKVKLIAQKKTSKLIIEFLRKCSKNVKVKILTSFEIKK